MNIQSMYDDRLVKDFELRCKDHVKLTCHKIILAFRTPIVRTFQPNEFQGILDEPQDFDWTKRNNRLHIFYRFHEKYFGDIAEELIFAADKYNLHELKHICKEKIIEKLSKDNVIQALLISDKISGCEKLFQECIEVVVG